MKELLPLERYLLWPGQKTGGVAYDPERCAVPITIIAGCTMQCLGKPLPGSIFCADHEDQELPEHTVPELDKPNP